MSGRQLRILIALLFLSTTAFAAYSDCNLLNGRSHPRDIFRRTSIADHVKDHFEKGTGKLEEITSTKPTYHGSVPVPAGTTSLTPHQLDEYAKAANAHLGDKATNTADTHVMGAAYRTGSDKVYLHSQPKGSQVFNPASHTNDALAGKMREGQQQYPDGRFNHHAETAAVNKGMKAEGSTSTSEWTVGQHGHFKGGNEVKEPCQGNCQKTFDAAGITYHDKHGNVKNPQRAATPPPAPASPQHAPASPQHAPASPEHAPASPQHRPASPAPVAESSTTGKRKSPPTPEKKPETQNKKKQ